MNSKKWLFSFTACCNSTVQIYFYYISIIIFPTIKWFFCSFQNQCHKVTYQIMLCTCKNLTNSCNLYYTTSQILSFLQSQCKWKSTFFLTLHINFIFSHAIFFNANDFWHCTYWKKTKLNYVTTNNIPEQLTKIIHK